MIPVLSRHSSVLLAYAPAVLAFVVALALALLSRGKRGAGWAPLAGAAGLLAGWAMLVPLPALLRAVATPRAASDVLLLPALAAVVVAGASPFLGARLQRWAQAGLVVLAGWWLASSAAGRPEFWRVWVAVILLAWLMSRALAGQASRSLAAGLALWGGLVAVAAPAPWIAAALVAAAAAAGLLAAGGALPAALVAAVIAGAGLGAGRLVRGGLNAVDLACLAACAAPLLAGPLAARIGRRLGPAGPAVGAAAAAALSAGVAWAGARLMRGS